MEYEHLKLVLPWDGKECMIVPIKLTQSPHNIHTRCWYIKDFRYLLQILQDEPHSMVQRYIMLTGKYTVKIGHKHIWLIKFYPNHVANSM